MAEPERLLTVRDIANRLACSRNLAYELVATASIPSIRLAGGRAIRVQPATLDRWLAEQEQPATESAARASISPAARNGGLHVARRCKSA